MPRLLSALLAMAALTAAPGVAHACGGLFCAASVPDATPVPPAPVDQNAERIIFEVDRAAGTITTHVQIGYVGPSESFAWVVPVPSVPEVADSTLELFATVDQQTRLQVVLPAQEPCAVPDPGCACVLGPAGSDDTAPARPAPEPGPGASPVTIYGQGATATYEYTIIGASVAADLIEWLQDNAYNVSDNMTPVMDVYNQDGNVFLALKLLADRTASDIAPIAMTYAAEHPMIPIELTAVAAQPLMGILVFIVADQPYEPANWAWTLPDTTQIVHDAQSRTNYFEWVARAATEAAGRLWVVELVGPHTLAGSFTQPIISRFYTRLSPELMTVDPSFVPATDTQWAVSPVLDLTANPSLYACGSLLTEREPSACAFNYCGPGAECAVNDGRVACVCAPGDVAQPVSSPDGVTRLTCARAENPYGVSPAAGGAGTSFDPCASRDCGLGRCVLKSGFATCECDAEAAACLEPDGSLTCVETPSALRTFGPGAGAEARGQLATALEATSARHRLAWLPLVCLGGLLVGRRIRRHYEG